MKYIRRFHQWLKEQGASARDHSYKRSSASGQVAAWLLTPKEPPSGLCIFAHATGNDAFFPNLTLFAQLIQRNLAIFTFDLDGHGRHSSTYLFPETIVKCVDQAICEAQQQFKHTLPLHLIGQSLGAALALLTASRASNEIASLSLVSLPTVPYVHSLTFLSELLTPLRPCFYTQMRRYGPYGILPALFNFKRAQYPIRLAIGESRPYHKVISDLLSSLALENAASQLHIPTLFVNGRFDFISPPAMIEPISRLMPSNLVRTLTVTENHFTTSLSPEVGKEITQFILALNNFSKFS